MALAEIDVVGTQGYDKKYRKPKRRRAAARFTLEVFEQMFQVPNDIRITHVSFTPERGIITFYLEGDGLPEEFEAPEGQEAREVLLVIPAWKDLYKKFNVDVLE